MKSSIGNGEDILESGVKEEEGEIQNVVCNKCKKEPQEYIQLDCGHSFCLLCLLVMNSSKIEQEQYNQTDETEFLLEITCDLCSDKTLLDKASTQALTNTLNQVIEANHMNQKDDQNNEQFNHNDFYYQLDKQTVQQVDKWQEQYIKMAQEPFNLKDFEQEQNSNDSLRIQNNSQIQQQHQNNIQNIIYSQKDIIPNNEQSMDQDYQNNSTQYQNGLNHINVNNNYDYSNNNASHINKNHQQQKDQLQQQQQLEIQNLQQKFEQQKKMQQESYKQQIGMQSQFIQQQQKNFQQEPQTQQQSENTYSNNNQIISQQQPYIQQENQSYFVDSIGYEKNKQQINNLENQIHFKPDQNLIDIQLEQQQMLQNLHNQQSGQIVQFDSDQKSAYKLQKQQNQQSTQNLIQSQNQQSTNNFKERQNQESPQKTKLFCKIHVQFEITYNCEDCQRLICTKCLDNHKNHVISSKQKLLNKKIKLIEENIIKIERQKIKDQQNKEQADIKHTQQKQQINQIKQLIHLQFKELQQKLVNKENELNAKVVSQIQQTDQQFQEEQKKTDKIINKQDSLLLQMRESVRYMQQESETESLADYNIYIEKMNQLKREEHELVVVREHLAIAEQQLAYRNVQQQTSQLQGYLANLDLLGMHIHRHNLYDPTNPTTPLNHKHVYDSGLFHAKQSQLQQPSQSHTQSNKNLISLHSHQKKCRTQLQTSISPVRVPNIHYASQTKLFNEGVSNKEKMTLNSYLQAYNRPQENNGLSAGKRLFGYNVESQQKSFSFIKKNEYYRERQYLKSKHNNLISKSINSSVLNKLNQQQGNYETNRYQYLK